MNVAIDLTALMPVHAGVDQYLQRLVIWLGRIDTRNRYTVFVNHEDRRLFAGLLPGNFTVLPWLSRRPRPARLLFQQVALPAAAHVLRADVVHSPAFIMPMFRGRPRQLLTVYDLSAFSLPETHIPIRRSRLYRQAVVRSICQADRVNVPSHAVKADVLSLVPSVKEERITVIPAGVGEEFHPRRPDDVRVDRDRLGLDWPYILYVGTIEPRKNLSRLVASYHQLIADGELTEHLVLAGQMGSRDDALLAELESPDLRGRVHLTGYVPQDELPWLYRGARLFVYPSLQEGFGFPPLEAMACGVPTIASRSSSLTENLEGAAELVEPTDGTGLTAAMRRLLTDEQLRTQRREQGMARAVRFRWEDTARMTIDCYEQLAAQR